MTDINPAPNSAKSNVTALAARVNLRIAQRHLDALGGGDFTFQTFPDNDGGDPRKLTRVLHGTLAKHGAALTKLDDAGAGIYVTVNRTDLKGRKAENVVEVRSNFVDLDGAPLAPVLEFPLKPDIVIATSPGKFHVYWLADKTRAADLVGFTERQRKLAAQFRADPKCVDLPRVLRLAGFIHKKSEPFRVRIEQQ